MAELLRIPYVCNDAIIWRPDWVPTPRDQRAVEMEAATRGAAWTFDGNFSAAEDRVILQRCDTIVWLDLPRWQVWPQVTWRTLRGLVMKTPHWQNGNIERWSIFFSRENIIWWSVRTYSRRRREYAALFADPAYGNRTRIRLKSRRQASQWLSRVEV